MLTRSLKLCCKWAVLKLVDVFSVLTSSYTCEFLGKCPPVLGDTVTLSPPFSCIPQPCYQYSGVHFGARWAIQEVSVLAVIRWCQHWFLLSLQHVLRASTHSRSWAVPTNVLDATAATADSQPRPWGVCWLHIPSFKAIFIVLCLILWLFSFSLGHLGLIILQEVRANKRKTFAMNTHVL